MLKPGLAAYCVTQQSLPLSLVARILKLARGSLFNSLLLSSILLPATALASGSQAVYQYTQRNGVVAFSDRQPLGQPYRLLKFDCFACNTHSTLDWQKTPLFRQLFTEEIKLAAKTHQLDPALIQAVIHAESAFKQQAISKAGARGLMQLMPDTGKLFALEDWFAPGANIMAGSAYLAQLLKQHSGNVRLATAAYNAGPTAVQKHQGVPPYPETQAYVQRVQTLWLRYQQQPL